MQKIGVALVDPATGTIEQEWPSMPAAITHAGEERTGAIVGSEFAGGRLLVERVCDDAPSNRPIVSEQSTWVDGRVIVTRSYGPPDYDALRAALVSSVKAQAGRIILDYCPQYKQANLTAQAAELALLFPSTKGEDLPEPYRAAWVAGQAIWGKIKLIRTHSNVLEAEAMALPDDQIEGWEQHGWPEP